MVVPGGGQIRAIAAVGKGIATARRTVTALTRAQDLALAKVLADPNKMHHIFGKAGHNLAPLIKELGGREALVREAILAIPRSQSGAFEISTQLGRHTLVVSGTVVDGVPRIGTMFVPL
jgi:hypothetical protein